MSVHILFIFIKIYVDYKKIETKNSADCPNFCDQLKEQSIWPSNLDLQTMIPKPDASKLSIKF